MYESFFNIESLRWIKTNSRTAISKIKKYTNETIMNPRTNNIINVNSSVGKNFKTKTML
jgi:hypothetical protein